MIRRNTESPQLLWNLNNSGYQAHINVPFDMAVEEPHSGVCSLVAEDDVGVCVNGDDVPAHGGVGKVARVSIEGPFSRFRALANLELVSVEVERVDGGVEVVDYNLDYVASGDYEGVDGAVD